MATEIQIQRFVKTITTWDASKLLGFYSIVVGTNAASAQYGERDEALEILRKEIKSRMSH